ncbi:hypothetical protein [Streptomyces noursei]|uniref:hypothetical protein n=1 Tax=Streptomyces noursei TaxID=1971 RepID=UPI0030F20B96
MSAAAGSAAWPNSRAVRAFSRPLSTAEPTWELPSGSQRAAAAIPTVALGVAGPNSLIRAWCTIPIDLK